MITEKLHVGLVKRIKASSPFRIIVSSFVILIIIGTLILKLPFSSSDGVSKPFIDCLFTATSATCVTGLSICDTYTGWSIFGQAVILLLIQCGGLGLITFAAAFTLLARKKLGLRDLQIFKEYTSGNIMDIPKLVYTILLMTLICEITGAILLSISFVPRYGLLGVWAAIFTSVSAYCNAGFDIFGFIEPSQSMIPFAGDKYVCIVVMALIVVGGIGFIAVFNINTVIKEKLTHKKNHVEISFYTKMVLVTTAVLILFGAASFFVSEYNNALQGYDLGDKINISFFQSITSRTAGFTVSDLYYHHDITKFITVILMFIGASPVSTGGGIKTTTIVVIFGTVISVLKGRDETVIRKHRINKNVVYSALAISVVSLTYILIATGIIAAIESERDISMFNILLETTSAYSTTGLSASVTPHLKSASKAILILSMLIGRVGPLSLFLSISGKKTNSNSKILPEGKIIVG